MELMKFRWIALIFLVILILWFGSGWFIYKVWDENTRGTIGDMFGAINSLFAGLAFAGLILTIAIQRKELTVQTDAVKMQTEELKMQREEISRSADQLEKQRKLMDFQIILGTLTGMLAVKREAINNIRYDSSTGLAVFKHVIVHKRNRQDKLVESYRKELNYYLSVYFDTLQYIMHSELDDSQKEELMSLVFTHTSTEEASVLMFFSENNQHRLFLLNKVRIGEKVKGRELSKNGINS